jgi:hypothetical protein
MLRLKKVGIDCKMYLMKEYLHGCNQMDTKGFGIDEYHNAVLLEIKVFKELFGMPINQEIAKL